MDQVPSREIYWNISEHLFLYILFLPFLAIFLYGCYRAWGALLLGKGEVRLGELKARLKALTNQGFLQRISPGDFSSSSSPPPWLLSRITLASRSSRVPSISISCPSLSISSASRPSLER
jgi:hypothetical protein